MILKGLKRNALKKNIETYLQKRDKTLSNKVKLKTLAVLIDASQSVNILSLLKLANELGVTSDRLKVMGYKEDHKEVEDATAAYYNSKSIGVGGKMKSSALEEFVNTSYDVLINFYTEEKLELDFVAAASKAKFKIGFAEIDNRINDLVIGSSIEDPNLFISELKKYLKILGII
ncbi:DUF6913 domain-containing protein [Aquimarina rhabdastrellae]